jgi:hypothetical protein
LKVVLIGMLAFALFIVSLAPLSASADNSTLEKVIIKETYYGGTSEWDTGHTINDNNGSSLAFYVKNRGTSTITVKIYKNETLVGTARLTTKGSYYNPTFSNPGSSTGEYWRIVVTGTG